MRWKLLRRRLSISAPRMIVRSHLPWPLRWVVLALMLGFSAALGLWAFETGKDLAGLDRDAKAELAALRVEVAALRSEREQALSTANTAESLLKAEKTALDRLAAQLRQAEVETLALKNDLGFYERLLPAGSGDGLAVRGLQAEAVAPGRVRYQLLLMQAGRTLPDFSGRYELTVSGTIDGRPWSFTPPAGPQPLQLKHMLRIEGLIDHPPQAVVKTIAVKVTDAAGALKATQSARVLAP